MQIYGFPIDPSRCLEYALRNNICPSLDCTKRPSRKKLCRAGIAGMLKEINGDAGAGRRAVEVVKCWVRGTPREVFVLAVRREGDWTEGIGDAELLGDYKQIEEIRELGGGCHLGWFRPLQERIGHRLAWSQEQVMDEDEWRVVIERVEEDRANLREVLGKYSREVRKRRFAGMMKLISKRSNLVQVRRVDSHVSY